MIVFDLSVEISFPGASDYSILFVVECKNYRTPVPVDDAEEFFSKLQQISGANVKGVIASASAFQRGARTYSRSKGIGLLRYFDRRRFKWELRRSPSTCYDGSSTPNSLEVEKGLEFQDYESRMFDLYGQSTSAVTNSFREFTADMIATELSGQDDFACLWNSQNASATQVRFVDVEDIEGLCDEARALIGHKEGEVALEEICKKERTRSGLKLRHRKRPATDGLPENVLGRITFEPLEIQLFSQEISHAGRLRFTLAHELGHYFLNHGSYLVGEFCELSDFESDDNPVIVLADIRRMEWQANRFASSLLMPRADIAEDFEALLRRLDVVDRGFGPLFVDYQPCNLRNYEMVTGSLMRKYGVSRSAVRNRLEDLGLLTDARNKQGLRSIGAELTRV